MSLADVNSNYDGWLSPNEEALKKLKDINNCMCGCVSVLNHLAAINKGIKKGKITKEAYAEIADGCVEYMKYVYSKIYADVDAVSLSSEIIINMAKKDKSFTPKAVEAFATIMSFQSKNVNPTFMQAFNKASKNIKKLFKSEIKDFEVINTIAKIAVTTDKFQPSATNIHSPGDLAIYQKRVNEAAKSAGIKWRKKYCGK